jgi:hypothetical protein
MAEGGVYGTSVEEQENNLGLQKSFSSQKRGSCRNQASMPAGG